MRNRLNVEFVRRKHTGRVPIRDKTQEVQAVTAPSGPDRPVRGFAIVCLRGLPDSSNSFKPRVKSQS
jgi:hypothetical protein